MKFEVFDEVVLLRDLINGVDFISIENENYYKDSIATIIEDNGDYVMLEFHDDKYKDKVHAVSKKDIKKRI